MRTKKAEIGRFGVRAFFKSMLTLIKALESEVDTISIEMGKFKRMTEDIIAQGSVLAKSGFKYSRYVNKIGPDRCKALALNVEKKLWHRRLWKRKSLKNFPLEQS